MRFTTQIPCPKQDYDAPTDYLGITDGLNISHEALHSTATDSTLHETTFPADRFKPSGAAMDAKALTVANMTKI
jgi:hypothetical protein